MKDEVSTRTVPIDLGAHPYLCVGDIRYCPDGFTLSFKYEPSTGNRQQKVAYILSNGGQSHLSNGFYFRRNYGMEFEIGVSLLNQIWVAIFNLREDVESDISIAWDHELKVYIDGKLAEEDGNGKARLYTEPMYDQFPKLFIGKANDDPSEGLSHEMTISNIEHTNVMYTQDEVFEKIGTLI